MSKTTEFELGRRKIGRAHRPFVIAEMSGNHNQSLDQALKIVDAAAEAGADALKIQTYTSDTMTLNCDKPEFSIHDPKSLWNGRSLYELYKEAYTPWEWHKPIFDRCAAKGIVGFSTPFDASAVAFLEEIGNPIYKIASFELIDLPLIRRAARTGKPLIISTGMATTGEIEEAVVTARSEGAKNIVLLKCTSSYPASPTNTNIVTIPHLRELFNTEVGISDHTLGVGVAVGAVALGATVIEKHFTLDRSAGGVDSAFSLEPGELHQLVTESERAWQSLGEISYGPTEKEKPSLQFRRSLYIAEDVRAGEQLNETNLRVIRPGYGLHPKYFDLLLGRRLKMDVKKGTAVSWDLFL
jgi:pseudaminic acid synthase